MRIQDSRNSVALFIVLSVVASAHRIQKIASLTLCGPTKTRRKARDKEGKVTENRQVEKRFSLER